MQDPDIIAGYFEAVRKAIRKAERAAGREEGATSLIAVTKTQSQETLKAALDAGQRIFGENKVQEAQSHWAGCKDAYRDIDLHLIGPLQTNKARDAVALFDCIQTLDREKLAAALAEEMARQGRALSFFIQVNTGEEDQKAGIAPRGLETFTRFCREQCGLTVKGLMCIPPAEEPAALHFALLKKLAAENGLSQLSMGMSADYLKAIALGATHVRLGTALFGAR